MCDLATLGVLRNLSTLALRSPSVPRAAFRRWHSSLSTGAKGIVFEHDAPAGPHLVHIHIPSHNPVDLPYSVAAELQTKLRQSFLSWKSAPAEHDTPNPVLITFTPTPTYTLGRRQKSLTPSQRSRLRQPLTCQFAPEDGVSAPLKQEYVPVVIETDRGGLTTYHGPGQLVLWPVIDIHSPLYTSLSVRGYARLLEETTRATLDTLFGIKTYLSEDDPGVWVQPARTTGQEDGQERKIAAMGVHLRRHITGLGVAINIDVPISGREDMNPWARFVPCGLDGKAVTSVADELGGVTGKSGEDVDMQSVGQAWARELASRLKLTTVRQAVFDLADT